MKARHLTPMKVHVATNTTLSTAAVVTFVMHFVSPEFEALAFCVTSLLAFWSTDVERKLRHPHLTFHKIEVADAAV